MSKIRKNYRINEEVVQMMETLIPFISGEKNIKLNETMLLEMLVSERYERFLKEQE